MNLLRTLLVSVLLACAGCGDGVATKTVAPPPAREMAKAILQGLADRGEMNSGVDALQGHLEAMKATDSAKAEALLADYKDLKSLSNPQAIKTKAKAMLEKL